MLAALALTANGDFAFPGFLATLVAGWLCGFWFVGRTLETREPWHGAVTHAAVAIALVPAMIAMVELLPGLLPSGAVSATFAVVQMAVVPAAGWIWITLIGRISSLARRPADRTPAVPAWESDGQGTVLRFTAVPVTMARLRWLVAAATAAAGIAAALALIATGDLAERLGARIVIIVFGVALALPAYLLVVRTLRRRTVPCSVRLVRDRMRIEIGATVHEFAIRELDLLRWRTDGDTAGVEVRAPGVDVSLIVGVARPAPGIAAQLPPLSGRMIRVLSGSRLVSEGSRHGVTTLLPPRDADRARRRSGRAA